MVQGLASTTKLTAITQSFRELRSGHLVQILSLPPFGQKLTPLACPLSFYCLSSSSPTNSFSSLDNEPRACMYTASSMSPHTPLCLR